MPVRIQDLAANATLIESTDLLMISQPGRTPSSRKITAQNLLAGPYHAASLCLSKATNLSDLPSASAARANLGLGTAAVHSATDFDPSGAAAAEQTRAQAVETILQTVTTQLSAATVSVTPATSAPSAATIATLALPAGTYMISGMVTLESFVTVAGDYLFNGWIVVTGETPRTQDVGVHYDGAMTTGNKGSTLAICERPVTIPEGGGTAVLTASLRSAGASSALAWGRVTARRIS